MTILIFPSSLEHSLAYAKTLKHHNKKVIGASSLISDPFAKHYDHWEQLPFIHEENFLQELRQLIDKYDITSIYTPHAPSYLRFTELADKIPSIRLEGESPYSTQMQRITDIKALAQEQLKRVKHLSNNPEHLNENFLAAVLWQALQIYGECSSEKIAALYVVLEDSPQGDIVEIGASFGKSAYVLNRLAVHFDIGVTLTVDPWDLNHARQYDSPSTIFNLSSMWDWELIFQGFLLNLQGCHGGSFNYIRATSEKAWSQYKQAGSVTTPEFGETKLTGKIAVLHIDGNHDEKEVSKDFDNWGSLVMPGGWIIFDDYLWSQGQGPYNTVEKVKRQWQHKIARDFVAGGAAFLKLKE